jgi:DNA-binding NarL/FixJ family response regulator
MRVRGKGIKVFVIDDHEVVRQGLRILINGTAGLSIVGEAEEERAAVCGIVEKAPDVVLLDITLRRSDGLDLIRALRLKKIRVPVIVLSMHEESVYAYKAIRMGAMGYVMKSEPAQTIIQAIKTVVKGERYLSDRIKTSVLHRINCTRTFDYDILDDLSSRERQIFLLLGRGLPPKAVASELGVSKKTIDTHRYRMIHKLGLDSGYSLIMSASNWCHAEGITAEML